LSVLTGKRDDAVDAAGSSAVEIKGQRVQPQRKNRKKK
jgi:YidC/Oxa1 family membrane protein insertase